MHLLKFSSEDCGTCHRMSHYDAKVSEELGCSFPGSQRAGPTKRDVVVSLGF